MRTLHVHLLGELQILDDDGPLTTIDSPRLQSLLAYLLLHRDQATPRRRLAFLLWPDSSEAQAHTNLRKLLFELRRALPNAERCLEAKGATLQWRADAPFTLDVSAFEEAAQRATPADLAEAVALYRGDLLPSGYDDWISPIRERLHQLCTRALEQLIAFLERQGDYGSAIAYAQRLLQHDAVREETYRSLMRLYAARGAYADAIRTYRDCANVLERELNVQPSSATRAEFQRVLKLQSAAAAPPPDEAPLPARMHNLPLPLTSFIGRERERVEVKRILTPLPDLTPGPSPVEQFRQERGEGPGVGGEVRLLTLTGEGGIGKTRLALQVAHDLAKPSDGEALPFADGIWLVELAPLSDSALVAQAVAAALGVREEPGVALSTTLTNFVQRKNLLLLLDNCEHLVEACALLAETLLRAAERIKILATSREALGVAGESVWRVPSLSLPSISAEWRVLSAESGPAIHAQHFTQSEAVRLFTERAAAALPSFTLTKDNAALVAQICQRLDGMPLAIELAAAQVRGLSLEQIAALLDERFRSFKGSRTAPHRHQTLQAALDWSYELLSKNERALFRRLAVFVGGWTLEAAEQVASEDDPVTRHPSLVTSNVLDWLLRLVNKSLVAANEQDGQMRYRFLETVRQYARHQLRESAEAERTHARHLSYFLALAQNAEPHLRGAQQGAWLKRLELEHDNFRAALEWSTTSGAVEAGLQLAVALWRFWWYHGDLSEGRKWLHAVLARSESVSPSLRALALNAAGVLARDQGDYAQAITLTEQSLALFRQLADRQGIAYGLTTLGGIAFYQGDYARAQTLQEESLALWRELGERRGIAYSLTNLGRTALECGHATAAKLLCDESLALCRELGDKVGVAIGLDNLGDVALYEGDSARAASLYAESLSTYQELGDSQGSAEGLEAMASALTAQGRVAQAVRLYAAASALREMIGAPVPPSERAPYERNMADWRRQLGEAEFAEAWALGRALTLDQAIASALACGSPSPDDELLSSGEGDGG